MMKLIVSIVLIITLSNNMVLAKRYFLSEQNLGASAQIKTPINSSQSLASVVQYEEDITYKKPRLYLINSENKFIPQSETSMVKVEKPEIRLDTPSQNTFRVNKEKFVLSGKVKNVKDLYLNNYILDINKKGEFYYEVPVEAKAGYNSYILKAISNDNVEETRLLQAEYVVNDKPLSIFGIPKGTVSNRQHNIDLLKSYLGKELRSDFSFKNIDLQGFINLISEEYSINILYNGTNLEKNVSFSVENIHPVDVLDTLVNSWGCRWYLHDDMVFIENNFPIKVFKLNYASVKDIVDAITGIADLKNIKIQESNNSIIAHGDIRGLAQLSEIIDSLDQKPKQVRIEAKILETSVDFQQTFGVNFTNILKDGSLDFNVLKGKIPLDLLYTNSNIDILANPKILVTNHKNASILAGHSFGYTTLSTNGNNTLENMHFLQTGVKLTITPHINNHNEIIMDIEPEVSEGSVENNRPRTSTTTAKTQVMIKHGQTLVIGGLIQKKDLKAAKGTPWISKLPILKYLFKSNEQLDLKREIVVLITPYIEGLEDSKLIEDKEKG
ncbi:hypothetical protein DID75_01085 [Candidatus Marinamargulisbacteria bacterium SCGC AG-410-N11]|nr:hypothetical protein DID75_01085 [Candidatus Marinamargulisbacteria bacterium SCGC AG-410-N11]